MRYQLATYIFLGALLFLGGCGQRSGSVRPESDLPVIEKGVNHYQQGDYFTALPVLLEAYETGQSQYDLAVMILDSYIQLGEYTRGWGFVNQYDLSDGKEMIILKSELLAYGGQYQQSLNDLATIEMKEPLELKWIIRGLTLKQQLYSQLMEPLQAALSGVNLYQYQPNKAVIDSIVSDLLKVRDEDLMQLLQDSSLTVEQLPWIEAAYIDFGSNEETRQEWLERWPDHPMAVYFYQNLTATSNYKNIAYLLPLTGRFGAVGKAIQQGVLAASFEHLQMESRVRFYDTGSVGESFSSAWYSAQEDNAEVIIGPVDKESISQLNNYSKPSVPVLLLNRSPQTIYNQFSLSPENEAEIVAEGMYEDGLRRVLVMGHRDELGQRISQAFINTFLQMGGLVINQSFYHESESDYSGQLRQSLGLVESQLRAKKLQRLLSRKLYSSEQTHSDVDAIFIAARPQFSRLLMPQLKFHRAGKIPVYSTSHVFSGLVNHNLDRDLNGLKFAISHFELGAGDQMENMNFDFDSVTVDRRLFAFGYDTVLLASRLDWLQGFPGGQLNGLSGQLYLGLDGVIRRRLDWAVFEDGQPVVLEK